MAQSDIQVLVGVLGGGSIRGESARLMKNQIGEIMNGISKSGNAALRIEKIIVAKQAKDSLRTALSSANLSAEIQNLTLSSTAVSSLQSSIDAADIQLTIDKIQFGANAQQSLQASFAAANIPITIQSIIASQAAVTGLQTAIGSAMVNQTLSGVTIDPASLTKMADDIRTTIEGMAPVEVPWKWKGTQKKPKGGGPRSPSGGRGGNYGAREWMRAMQLRTKMNTTVLADHNSSLYREQRTQALEHTRNASTWVSDEAARTGRTRQDIIGDLSALESVIAAQDRRAEKEAAFRDQTQRTSLTAQTSYNKVADSIHQYWLKNQDVIAQNPTIYEQMNSLHDQVMSGDFQGTAKEANAQFMELRRQIGDAGADVETLGQKVVRVFKDKFGYGIMAAAAASARKAISQLYTNVVELDSAMAQMKIVTGASTKALKEYSEGAAEAAKETGRTMTEIMESSTEYARLGYTLEESLDLSKTTAMLSNVADIDTATATSSMTAILKGFRLEASDAQMVGDMMTKVANEYAIDAGELGAALERGGASLAAANNTLAESMALMAAGNAAIQNAETVGKQHCPAA